MNFNEAMLKLKEYNQEHVLKYYDELDVNQSITMVTR